MSADARIKVTPSGQVIVLAREVKAVDVPGATIEQDTMGVVSISPDQNVIQRVGMQITKEYRY